MKRVTRDHVIYYLGHPVPPILTVAPGEEIVIETLDTASGKITREDYFPFTRPINPGYGNPLTGPIAVAGARPGDTLVAKIIHVQCASRGYEAVLSGAGVATVEQPAIRIIPIEGDMVVTREGIRFPVRPVVGAIGVAPAGEPVATCFPGTHGGNLDIPLIAPGARVYLPVTVEGGMFALGDVHASQGDGELAGAPIEVAAEVTVRLDVLSGRRWSWPWIETAEVWATCACGPTVEEGLRIATDNMASLLMEKLEVPRTAALMLISARADGRIGQVGWPIDVTTYVTFPKLG